MKIFKCTQDRRRLISKMNMILIQRSFVSCEIVIIVGGGAFRISSKFIGKRNKHLYHKFHFKNMLIMDKNFNNAIFEIFVPEYNEDTEDNESIISEESLTNELEKLEEDLFVNNLKLSESHEAEGEDFEEEKDHTVGDIDETPQNEAHVARLIENSNKMIRYRKKLSTKNAIKPKLMGEKSLQNIFKAANQQRRRAKMTSKKIGTVDDPDLLFRGGRGSSGSEKLDSITSQMDDLSISSTEGFTYETEKRLFAPIWLKKKNRSFKKGTIMRAFKKRPTAKLS
jgi:hypothetical protein